MGGGIVTERRAMLWMWKTRLIRRALCGRAHPELVHVGLTHQHRARFAQTLHTRRVVLFVSCTPSHPATQRLSLSLAPIRASEPDRHTTYIEATTAARLSSVLDGKCPSADAQAYARKGKRGVARRRSWFEGRMREGRWRWRRCAPAADTPAGCESRTWSASPAARCCPSRR